METQYCTARPRVPKKSIFTTRKEHPSRQLHLQRRFQDEGVKQPMRQSVSDTQVEFYKKTPRNKLKRTRAVEDISSGTTISKSIYEPRKKRKKGNTGVCIPSHSIEDTLKTIYKNPNFSISRESVPNRISPPAISWSFDSYLYCQMVREAMAGIYREHSVYSTPRKTSSENLRVATVTKNDGSKAQIIFRKAVLMHVKETPAHHTEVKEEGEKEDEEIESSVVDVEDDQNSSGILPATVGEYLKCQRRKRKFINHVSSLELLRLKTFSNERLKCPRLSQPESSVSSTCPDEKPTTKEVETQFPSTPQMPPPPPHNTDGLQKEDIASTTNSTLSIRRPELKVPRAVALKRVDGFTVYRQSETNELPMSRSKSDAVPCTFIVFVCFLLTRWLGLNVTS